MLSGKLWPAHPKPYPDELLSSWIARIAEANGIKSYTLTRLLFGKDLNPWLLDIDRLAPEWLLQAFCARTGTTPRAARRATLLAYRQRIFRDPQRSGPLRWVLPMKPKGAKRRGFGLQYCPRCLAEGPEPYFRRCWRLSFTTFCPAHMLMLHDACASCGAPVALHRRDFGRSAREAGGLCVCPSCRSDYRRSPHVPLPAPGAESAVFHRKMLLAIERKVGKRSRFDLGFFAVLHQFCKLVASWTDRGRLHAYLLEKTGLSAQEVTPSRAPFEQRRVGERHYVLSLALWMMKLPRRRLKVAWKAKAVRHKSLSDDLDDPPVWFSELVEMFSENRRVGRLEREGLYQGSRQSGQRTGQIKPETL